MQFDCQLKTLKTPWLTTLYTSLVKTHKETRLGHGLLFTGIDGVGRFKLAQQIAKYILCSNKTHSNNSCNICHSCNLIAANTHLDLQLLIKEQNKQSITIDQIRTLINNLNDCAHLGNNKIVIIKDAQFLSIQAANALLKTLEEPQSNTYLILLTNTREQLLPTLRSRVQHTHIYTPNTKTLTNWLISQGINLPDQGLFPLFKNSPLALFNHLQSNAIDPRKSCVEGLFSLQHDPQSLFIFSEYLAKSTDKNLEILFFLLHDLHKLKMSHNASKQSIIFNFALPQLIIWQDQITFKSLRMLSLNILKIRTLLITHSALKEDLLINALLIKIKNAFQISQNLG
ncbi:MAG: DNA polymerase III subunit delta' [Psychromonas sp.]|nr:DNA polymerase III subunit delta' [Psychromonas sp.]